jgi:hypothetical protein
MSRTRGVEVYPGIIKLDPSAPYFVQSRTLAEYTEKWAKVIRAANIKPE